MKWFLVIGLFVYYAELSAGSVIKDPNGANDKVSPITETKEKEYLNTEAFGTYKDVRIEVECLSGSEWESNCHSCRCSEEGRAVCSKLDICDKGSNGEPLRCKPQTLFKRDCNTCRCLDNGLVLCTLKGCPRSSIPKKSDLLPGKDCSPGTRWKSRCNECICSSEGLTNCTKNECSGQENEPELGCAPDSVWKNDCNTCWCTSEGHVMCTRMGCSLHHVSDWNPQPVKPKNTNTVPSALKSAQNTSKAVVCTANQMFIKDCNTCWCNEDGTSFFCTRKVCILETPDDSSEEKPEDLRTIKQQCRPDEVFELDCNICRCNPDGQSYSCTRRICVPESDDKIIPPVIISPDNSESPFRRKRATSQGTPKTCQPGQEFRMDCNKCLCDNEGQDFSCTRIDCAALNSNNGADRTKREVTSQVQLNCTPGSVFDQGCNVCQCTADGNHAMCTMKRCHDESTDNDINAPESDPNFRCNPGEQFKRGCKDCTCSADGKSVFCTLRLCDQDMNPTL